MSPCPPSRWMATPIIGRYRQSSHLKCPPCLPPTCLMPRTCLSGCVHIHAHVVAIGCVFLLECMCVCTYPQPRVPPQAGAHCGRAGHQILACVCLCVCARVQNRACRPKPKLTVGGQAIKSLCVCAYVCVRARAEPRMPPQAGAHCGRAGHQILACVCLCVCVCARRTARAAPSQSSLRARWPPTSGAWPQ